MTKKRSTVSKQSPPPASVRATDVKPFVSTFIVKDTTLTLESELPDDVAYYPQPHLSKEAASAIVFANLSAPPPGLPDTPLRCDRDELLAQMFQ